MYKGTDRNDLDGDSIPDIQEACGPFIQAAGVDKDYDAIDDACDPQIEGVQVYRVRNGDVAKNENPEFMYIERNIHASNYTGILNDSDPDGDSWAVVGQSNSDRNAGTPARFWIDESKIPHVSVRTSDRGCVQYTPRSLKEVQSSRLRTLKQEARNASTCRDQPIMSDVDGDNTPDSQQILYRARNGDVEFGEDPSIIYLERNAVAAEAQLNVSDYDHAKTWNLLASSQSEATKAQFVKMVMVDQEPIILAKQARINSKGKTIVTCIALQPPYTKVITIPNTNKKLKKVPIPEGEKCE